MSSKVVCASALVAARVSRFRPRNRAPRRLVHAAESYAGTAQTVLPIGKARTLGDDYRRPIALITSGSVANVRDLVTHRESFAWAI